MQNEVNRASLRTLSNKKNLVGAEIGVSAGDNALDMLTKLDIKRLYLIDPYIVFSWWAQETLTNHKKIAYEILSGFEKKIVWLEMKSEDAINEIKEELDFVYIDGDHRYLSIKSDIELYYPKVKKDGLVAGDNLEDLSVRIAVAEYCRDKNLRLSYQENIGVKSVDWWYKKDAT